MAHSIPRSVLRSFPLVAGRSEPPPTHPSNRSRVEAFVAVKGELVAGDCSATGAER